MSDNHKIITKYKIDYLFLFILMFIYYGYIQWNNFIGDPDGFYHARMAQLISQGSIIKNLPWMQFSTLRDHFTDHQLLYHTLLAPLTTIFDPLIAVKVGTVLFATMMVLTFYWLLKKFQLTGAWFFALSFILLNGLNFRLSLVKVNSLSLLIIYLLIYALFKQKYKLSTLLGALFVWLYGGWPIAIILLIAYTISQKIHQQLNKKYLTIFGHKRLEIKNPWSIKINLLKSSVYLLVGIFLGLIVNPYWPQNIYFYYQQFLQIGVINMGDQFTVGNEWYGATLGQIFSASPHIFIAAFILILIIFINLKKISSLTIFSFLMAFGFLLLTFKSKRYVEYYLPLTLLFTASAFKDVLTFFNWKKYLNLWDKLSSPAKTHCLIGLAIILIAIMPITYDKILNVRLSGNYTLSKFAPASQWLKENTPKNSLIFHSDWDEWPILFYRNPHNYYLIGLDPTFMENYDQDLHTLYRNITYGNISYKPSQYIKKYFGAQYIFVDKSGHGKFIQNLSKDLDAKEVYQDNETIIYKII